MYRSVLAAYAVAFVLALAVGCSAPQPTPLIEEPGAAAGDMTMDAAGMLEAVEDTVTTGAEAAPAMEAAEPEPDPVAEAMERYDALEATVEQLQSDVDNLNAGQTVFQTELRSLEGRVEGVESSVEGMAERILSRFDNFDAEIARIRETVEDMPPPMPTPRVAPAVGQTTPPEPQGPARDVEAEGALQVDAWRQAWEAGDVDAYVAAYQQYASVTRYGLVEGTVGRKRTLNVEGLRTRMERLGRQYARMEVLVRGFRVVEEEGRMVATFQQDFSAWAAAGDLPPAYTDRGIKTLAFVEQDGGWLIIKEDWVPVQP
ncbi:hypothetical protein HOI71_15525 [Candidatus Poribacteria bacterium]|nr:hypothetical protein [Candidatus Poribacteria bacterium]